MATTDTVTAIGMVTTTVTARDTTMAPMKNGGVNSWLSNN